ncbi:hypothetical protein ACOSP7_008631 [Xanthoceras sorbifolium]
MSHFFKDKRLADSKRHNNAHTMPVRAIQDLTSPFFEAPLNLLDFDLRETAYEILIGACRSSGARPLTYILFFCPQVILPGNTHLYFLRHTQRILFTKPHHYLYVNGTTPYDINSSKFQPNKESIVSRKMTCRYMTDMVTI